MPDRKSYDVEIAERSNSSQEDDTYNRYWIMELMTFMALSCVIVELCLLWTYSTGPVTKPGAQIEGSRNSTENLTTIEENIDEVLTIQKQIRHDGDIRFQKTEGGFRKIIDTLIVQHPNEFNSKTTVNGTQNSGINSPSNQAKSREDKKIQEVEKTTISAGKLQSTKSLHEIPGSGSSSKSTTHGIGEDQNEFDSTTTVNGTQNSGINSPSKQANSREDKKIQDFEATTISAGKLQSTKSLDISRGIRESASSSKFTTHG